MGQNQIEKLSFIDKNNLDSGATNVDSFTNKTPQVNQVNNNKSTEREAFPISDINLLHEDKSQNLEKHEAKLEDTNEVDKYKNSALENTDKQKEDTLESQKSIDELDSADSENKLLSDKPNNTKEKDWIKILKQLDSWGNTSTIAVSLIGGALQLQKNLSQDMKDKVEKVSNFITNIGYSLYGLKNFVLSTKKRNLYSNLGFLGETILPWFGNLENLYLVRGIATGTDQLWVATDKKLSHLMEEKDGVKRFKKYKDSILNVPKAVIELLIETIKNPIKTIWTTDTSKGHHFNLSSLGSMFASAIYMLTGQEKLAGTMRDLSGVIFDIGMVFEKDNRQKAAGALFLGEAVLDFVARFLGENGARLFVNQLSHAVGRWALKIYGDTQEQKA